VCDNDGCRGGIPPAGKWGFEVAATVLRVFGGAALLVSGLLLAGLTAPGAAAAPGDDDHDDPGVGMTAAPHHDNDDGGETVTSPRSRQNPPQPRIGNGRTSNDSPLAGFPSIDRPTVTVGNGRVTNEAENLFRTIFNETIDVPVVRIGALHPPGSNPCGGQAVCITTYPMPVPTLSGVAALFDPRPQPQPQPQPQGPVLRIQGEEDVTAPPVVDAVGVGGVGRTDGAGPGGGGAPVLSAPLALPPRIPPGGLQAYGQYPGIPAVLSGPSQLGLPVPPGAMIPASPSSNQIFAGIPVPQSAAPPAQALRAPAPRGGKPLDGRTAALAQAAVALPGLAGLIAFTAGGGVIGYRQANAVRYVRTGAMRYLR